MLCHCLMLCLSLLGTILGCHFCMAGTCRNGSRNSSIVEILPASPANLRKSSFGTSSFVHKIIVLLESEVSAAFLVSLHFGGGWRDWGGNLQTNLNTWNFPEVITKATKLEVTSYNRKMNSETDLSHLSLPQAPNELLLNHHQKIWKQSMIHTWF